jgi:hypothetical protein
MRLTVNSDISLSEMIGAAREIFKEKKYFTVSFNTGKKRTVSQNALAHLWYGQVSLETGEYTPGHVKCLCKYHVGVPIIRAIPEEDRSEEVQKLCVFCEEILDGMTYETKIAVMEYMPVTSLMNTKQLSLYLTGVKDNYVKRGVILFFPDEWDQ